MKNRIIDAAHLKKYFLALIDKQYKEQIYQEFIENNTALVPREFIQNHGVYFDLVFRKLSLANDYATDFFYISKSSGDFNCVLIEIEKPQSKYFKHASNDFHPDFHAALDQINRWRAWFSNSSNLDGFINGTISPVKPEVMGQSLPHIKYVLVHGRRTEFEDNENKRRLITARETDDFHILSYDSLVESLHSKEELYLAIRKNEYIEILSSTFISEDLFASIPPSYIKITDELRKSILDNKKSWYHYSTSPDSTSPGQFRLTLEGVLPKIGVIHV